MRLIRFARNDGNEKGRIAIRPTYKCLGNFCIDFLGIRELPIMSSLRDFLILDVFNHSAIIIPKMSKKSKKCEILKKYKKLNN
jgi:hypothetical protein